MALFTKRPYTPYSKVFPETQVRFSPVWRRMPEGPAAELCDEQREFIKTVALRRVNVLLTAAAGSGKTTALRVLHQYAELNGVPVAVTASTGVAAMHLGGRTLHSWAGMGQAEDTPAAKSAYLLRVGKRDGAVRKRMRGTALLVVDEVSMLHPYLLEWLNEAAQRARDAPALPFGGMQVVLVGDFLQLDAVYRPGQDATPLFASAAVVAACLVPCNFKRLHRQDGADALVDILRHMRVGKTLPGPLMAALSGRQVGPADDIAQVAQGATCIVPTRKLVSKYNAMLTPASAPVFAPCLALIPAGARGRPCKVTTELDCVTLQYPARVAVVARGRRPPESATDPAASLSFADVRGMAAPPQDAQGAMDAMTVRMHAGSPVVITCNVTWVVDGRREPLAANGDLGVLVGLPGAASTLSVRLHRSGRTVEVPLVEKQWTVEGGVVELQWWPVQPARALTVHRVQGMTLPRILVDLGPDNFAPQQAYVALSRVRRLQDVFILPGWDPAVLTRVNGPAVAWSAMVADESMRRKCAVAAATKAPAAAPATAAATTAATATAATAPVSKRPRAS